MKHLLKPSIRCTALILAFASALCLQAQTITGEIDGTVKDPTGAAIPKASVVIVDSGTGETVRTVTTDLKGNYSAPLLTVGTYTVRASVPGFNTESVANVELHVSDILQINVQLALSTSQQTVTVTTTDTNISPQLDDAASSSIISGNEIRELALNTQNFEQMMFLQPGVSNGGDSDQLYTGQVQSNGKSNSANASVNGLRSTQNAWLLDGADMLSHSNGQQVVIFPAITTIQELTVLRNSYGAQYGGGGSAQIQLITRTGGNAYHGQAYFFLRNAALDANDYFNKVANEPRPEDNQYDGGFTLGGPLFIPRLYPKSSSKTFFFYSLDVKRQSVAKVLNLTNAPSPAELAGTFNSPVCTAYNTAGNCTASSSTVAINPTAAAYIAQVFANFPAPNNPLDPSNQSLILDQLGIHNETANLFRIDHSFSPRLSAFFRFIHDPIFILSPAGLYQNKGYAGLSTSDIWTYGTSYLAHATYTLTPTTVIDGAFNYQPYGINALPIGTLANGPLNSQFNLPFATPANAHVPSIILNGQAYTVTGPVSDQNRTYQAFANLFHTFGQHSLSIGVNIEHYTEIVNQGTLNAGQFTFQSNVPSGTGCGGVISPNCTTDFQQGLADFLQGYVADFQQNSIDPVSHPLVTMYEGYLQDDWRATPRLTINVGVRYSLYKQAVEASNHLGSFNASYFDPTLAPTIDLDGNICTSASIVPPATTCVGGAMPNPAYNPAAFNGIVLGGTNSPWGNAVSPQPYLNFAPRVGFAYNVYGDGQTSLRGGYGIYYNQTQLNVEQQTVFNNPAYLQVETYINPGSFSTPGSNPSTAPLTAFGISGNWKTPYTQAWSLGVQQQLMHHMMAEVDYIGNKSTHLIGEIDINQPYPGEYIGTGLFKNGQGVSIVNKTNTPLLNLIRPYQGYNTILDEATVFIANYNALQANLTASFGNHNLIGINYTWSRGLTTSEADTGVAPQNSYDIPAEYGLTAFDRRHVFTAHFVYNLPIYNKQIGWTGHILGGWEISGIVTFAAGLPLTPITSSVDPAGQGALSPTSPELTRPDVNSNPNADAPHTLSQWFVPSHFTAVPAGIGRPGNSPNGIVRGPGYQVWNLDLSKNIQLPNNLRLQLRGEAFNAWNHVNWNTVDMYFIDSTFGQVTADRDPRQLQVGVKLIY